MAYSQAEGGRETAQADGEESAPERGPRKLPPGPKLKSDSGATRKSDGRFAWKNRLLWEPGAGGRRPGGSWTARTPRGSV
jgi:hypothetical protein